MQEHDINLHKIKEGSEFAMNLLPKSSYHTLRRSNFKNERKISIVIIVFI